MLGTEFGTGYDVIGRGLVSDVIGEELVPSKKGVSGVMGLGCTTK